ncbi:ubiquitin carboxyl-terminal hydrolase 47-like [Paramormyrops kingsleyae]|uniref:ubiquitin carboxyl-terminal hydrolase 47-like n=1 Tax=Paramormyrops kingsleyae TaxID=1676925 RepID=UPI003B9713A7
MATRKRGYQSPSIKNQGKKPCNSASGIYDRPGGFTDDSKRLEKCRPEVTICGKSYYGLQNLRATCYLNAVLQTLFMTKQFREAVESLKPSTTFEDHLKKLFQKLKKGTAVVEDGLLINLGITNNYEQDAAEYFQKIVSLCSFTKIYHGELKYSTKCQKHGHESEPECSSFVILPLAIESHHSYNVMDGWKQFFKPSVLNGDNQLYCDVCEKKTDTETECELVSYPEVLTLQLKRFDFDYNYMMYMKNDCKVEIPLQLQVSQELYKLYAIIEHRGSVKSGHYYTIIKSFQDGNWYHFNDSWVTQVSPKIVDENIITSEHAYMLLYTRRVSGSAESCTDERHKVSGKSNASREVWSQSRRLWAQDKEQPRMGCQPTAED